MLSKPLAPTTLSQYVRLNNCDRYLWFRLFPSKTKELLERLDVTEQPLSSLLSESGADFEEEVVAMLAATGYPVVNLTESDANTTIKHLQGLPPRGTAALTQATLEGSLGGLPCAGNSDLIIASRDDDGLLSITLCDIKASRRERVEHRLQVAIYVSLLEQMLTASSIRFHPVSAAIIHRDENGQLPDPSGEWLHPFRLDPYRTAVANLTDGDEAVVQRILKSEFADLKYHLNYKCDGCMYNGLCVTDSNLRQDLSIIPHLQAVEKRVLQEAGIESLADLVALKQWPTSKEFPRTLPPAPGQEAKVKDLSAWPMGPVLDTLVVRARAVLRRWQKDLPTMGYIPHAGFSELPVGDDLVRIYLDAQHDFLQDRVYLLAARLEGPGDQLEVVHMTPSVPTEDTERDLFVGWVTELGKAAVACAGATRAKVHVYVYDNYDQKVILEGLKRHLSAVAAIPAFYDLLTQTAALTQPMVSFLAAEVRRSRPLPYLNQSLVRAASMLGFDWKDEKHDYFRLFQARIFDDRRKRDDTTIEVAARFNSQIPLEYAYHVWGRLLEGEGLDRKLLAPFRKVTLDAFLAFAAQRVRALVHMEQRLRPKASKVEKDPVTLTDLGVEGRPATDLPMALVHFLYIEHHAKVQELMQLYQLPIAKRSHTGRAVLLKCIQGGSQAQFDIQYRAVGLDPTLGPELVRFKEGAWCVLNPLVDDNGDETVGKRLAHGKVCVVESIDDKRITVSFPFTGRGDSDFKFKHWSPTIDPGQFYTLDEMADDLNGDKLADACRNAEDNLLVRFAGDPHAVPPPVYAREAKSATEDFVSRVNQLEHPYGLTAYQQEIVSGRLTEPVLLVQGPPGTGKSHTLGWAALARLLAMPVRTPRVVAVSSKTHNAINIVLGSIAGKWKRLQEGAPEGTAAQSLRGLGVYKITSDEGENLPDGVIGLNVYDQRRLAGTLLNQDLTVIGGTPGGLYNLMKYTRGLNWNDRVFDLVILDEASQMNLPEAVLACAFLKPGGQAIVVGDHRQMPPILAHGWKDEGRREAEAHMPYRSVFEFLLSLDAPRVGLDESFRVPKVLAEFLEEHIYRQDQILYFSKRTEVVPIHGTLDPFVLATLHPDYPIIVIEHDDERSQQASRAEAGVVVPIVAACSGFGLDGRTGVGIVVPHRAQKALLGARLAELRTAGAIDTVERFQGGERDVIIVSATVSDPDYALAEAEFLMDAKRLNVALSRPKKKLIVVGAASLFRLLPADPDVFEQASIWKLLRFSVDNQLLWSGEVDGVSVRVYGRAG